MAIDAVAVPLGDILLLREDYRREMNCQIVHDSWHARGFTQSYACLLEGTVVGYAAVGGAPGEPRDIVKEFYQHPETRRFALPLMRRVIAASGARRMQAQTNDRLLTLLMFDCTDSWESRTIVFEDAVTTSHRPPPGATFRPIAAAERDAVFTHVHEPVGEWGVEVDGRIAATGGFALHYNPPYADIYMEVDAPYRRRGFGSYLVQELKRACRAMGYIPGARTAVDNVASRLALERAGMLPCARIISGAIAD